LGTETLPQNTGGYKGGGGNCPPQRDQKKGKRRKGRRENEGKREKI